MVVDYLFRVVHAAVTDLDGVSVEDFSELVIFGKVLVYWGEEFVSNVGAGVLAKKEGCTRGCCCVVGFSVCLFWLVRAVVCGGIHFRRVLSGTEGRLGQRMLCQMIGTTVVC